jgi:hypothetical protein
MRKLLKLKEVFKSTLKGLALFISQFLKAADAFQSLFVDSPFERKEEKKNFFKEKFFFSGSSSSTFQRSISIDHKSSKSAKPSYKRSKFNKRGFKFKHQSGEKKLTEIQIR